MEFTGTEPPLLDEHAMAATFTRLRAAYGAHGLGKLEGLAIWLSGITRESPPPPLERRRLLVVAAGHGVAAAGVSASDAESDAREIARLRDLTSPAATLAAQAGVEVRVVEAGPVSERIDRAPALSADAFAAAFDAGVALADEEVDSGAGLLVTGTIGAGASTAAAALTCALASIEPVEAVGRGSGINDATWSRKVVVVRDALARSRARDLAPFDVAREVGGADIAMLVGLVTQAAARRTPVVLDGLVTAAAALVTARVVPTAAAYVLAAHRSSEPAHRRLLDALGLEPLLELGLGPGAGPGAGGLLAVPLLDAAIALTGA